MLQATEDAYLLRDRSMPMGLMESLFNRVRWKSLLTALWVLGAFLFVTFALLRNSSGPLTSAPAYPIIIQPAPGVLEVEGCEDGLHRFDGFDPDLDVEQFKSLKVRYLIIDAASFSQSLSSWTNLESLVIENVWMDGDFTRVNLPLLKKFIYHQYSNGNVDPYKQENVLNEILFFDKDSEQTWDLKKDLLNLDMSLQVKIAGTKLLKVEPSYGEVLINTPYCEDILVGYDPEEAMFNITTLTLHECSIGARAVNKLKVIGGPIQRLSLISALPTSSAELSGIISALPNLEELHLYNDMTNNLVLGTDLLPSTLETLSLTNIGVSITQAVIASIKKLSLDGSVDKSFLSNIQEIFPNLTDLAMFEPPESKELLEIGKKMSLESIIVTGFPSGVSIRPTVEQPSFPGESFVMKKTEAGYNTTQLSTFEKHFYRYKYLGFGKIYTYADYVFRDSCWK